MIPRPFSRAQIGAMIAAAVLATGVGLAFSSLSRRGIEIEERLLAMALDWAQRPADPAPVIVAADRTLSHGEIAKEVQALLAGGARAVGLLIPIDETSAPTDAAALRDDDTLALALRGSRRAAVSVRVESGRLVLPPARLAAELPLGFREGEVHLRGPFVRRLVHDFGDVPLQSMAAATLLAVRGQGETEIDEGGLGRLPADRQRPDPAPVVAAGAWRPGDVKGRVALLCVHADEARPTAAALRALLRLRKPLRIGVPDVLVALVFAGLGALAGRAFRPRLGGPLVLVLSGLAFGLCLLLAARGRPVLTIAPLVALVVAAGAMAAARAGALRAQKVSLRRTLRSQASAELAADLAADPLGLQPERRRICVLCATLSERSHLGLDSGETVAAIEAHEARVLGTVRSFGGIVCRLDGDEAVAIFGVSAAEGAFPPGHDSLLAVQAAFDLAQAAGPGQVALGLDAGEALCGLYGVERRYRVHGEVVGRAVRAARTAADRGVAIVATQQVANEVEGSIAVRPLERNGDVALFELAGPLSSSSAATRLI